MIIEERIKIVNWNDGVWVVFMIGCICFKFIVYVVFGIVLNIKYFI